MPSFLVLAWPPQDDEAAAAAGRLQARLEADGGWALQGRIAGAAAYAPTGVRRPMAISTSGRALLVGRVRAPVGEATLPPAWVRAVLDDDPVAACRRLTAGAWGEYVAVFPSGEAGPAAYRDPSGALEAFAWTASGGVSVVASGVEGVPPGLLPPRLALDWRRIRRILRQPGRSSLDSPLEGIVPLPAGALVELSSPERVTAVWTPARFISPERCDVAEAEAELVRRVDGVVAAMAGDHSRLVAEVSGGLDSAIVAASLVASGGADRCRAWINYHGSRREGDERSYARALAARLGLPLTEVALEVEPVGAADYADLARGVRPPMSALGRRYDRDMAERARAAGATAILTGQGGDAVFFQMPTPFLLEDALRLGGWRALFGGAWGDTARWTGRSAWSVLWALRDRRGAVAPAPAMPGLEAEAGAGEHPWIADAADAPPAKRLQVAALAAAQVYPGDSSRRRAADVLRPLLAQPVVEHLLSIPVPVLAAGGRDRALARRAFAPRLPPEIVQRRAKGALGAYYGEVVLASLDWLHPHLLEGSLCEAGVLDRRTLEAALQPGALVWDGGAVDVLAAALMESWVRWWQARIPDSASAPRPRAA